jgi:hypothetical protein
VPLSITVKRKKRGRPATGTDPLVGVRLPQDVIAKLDAWAEGQGVNRSEAVRKAIYAALGIAWAPPKVSKAEKD